VIRLLGRRLTLALGERALVQVQCPLAVSDHSEPEPDLAVLAPAADGYASGHPETALLVIEVAESSLATDRDIKADLYAEAAVPEYWIVDLSRGLAEARVAVFAEPGPDGYARVTYHGRDETLCPRAFPDIAVALAEFLPAPGQPDHPDHPGHR
ncbi:MAG: Uma2 family endonuclease, partial [Myxococcota bacterium]